MNAAAVAEALRAIGVAFGTLADAVMGAPSAAEVAAVDRPFPRKPPVNEAVPLGQKISRKTVESALEERGDVLAKLADLDLDSAGRPELKDIAEALGLKLGGRPDLRKGANAECTAKRVQTETAGRQPGRQRSTE